MLGVSEMKLQYSGTKTELVAIMRQQVVYCDYCIMGLDDIVGYMENPKVKIRKIWVDEEGMECEGFEDKPWALFLDV
jgi:hypothetical protein